MCRVLLIILLGTVTYPAFSLQFEITENQPDPPGSCGLTEIAPVFKWNSRIIGGHEAIPGSWPWQGYFEAFDQGKWIYHCGATLISNEWVLTAAHCLIKGSETRVVMGDHDRSEVNTTTQQNATVDSVRAPDEYDFDSEHGYFSGYDIALLHVSHQFNTTKWVKPICIPESSPDAGETVIITGWGSTSTSTSISKVLNQVRAKIYSKAQCDKIDTKLPDGVFCAGVETGAASGCSGDSGGPVVYLRNGTWEVAGIVSFAWNCGTAGRPSVYTDVSEYRSFINGIIAKEPTTPVLEMHVINNATDGTISSPNYGNASNPKYPPNTYIRWFIEAPKNKRITVRFEDAFNIKSDSCTQDYLLIYDGDTTAATQYRNQKICGPTAPPDFESNSNAIIVDFRSDGSIESIGFSFNYTTRDDCAQTEYRCWDGQCIPSDKQCDGTKDCESNEDEFECSLGDSSSVECGKPYIAPSFPWSPLIIGGHNAKEGSWPWIVGIYKNEEFYSICGGSIVSKSQVLTAAHCLSRDNTYQVGVADHNNQEKMINVAFMVIHPEYNYRGNDVAIVHLETPLDFTTKWVKPVCIPMLVDENPVVGTICIVSGWGQNGIDSNDYPDILQQVQTKILNDTICHEELQSKRLLEYDFICAGHARNRTSAWRGDSGGPLVCLVEGAWRQYGIVSFGFDSAARTYYERVSKHIDFINQGIAADFCTEYQIQKGTSGEVTIPTIIGQYLKYTNCSWLLQGPANCILRIQIKMLNVEDCQYNHYYDYLTVYDGNSTASRKLLDQVFCGNSRTIRKFLSSTNEVLMTFISDSIIQLTGFRLSWIAVVSPNASKTTSSPAVTHTTKFKNAATSGISTTATDGAKFETTRATTSINSTTATDGAESEIIRANTSGTSRTATDSAESETTRAATKTTEATESSVERKAPKIVFLALMACVAGFANCFA